MNPTQEQIKFWIDKCQTFSTNEIIEFSISDFTNQPLKYFKRFVLEMEIQIDRRDLIMEYIFVNPKMENFLLSYLGADVNLPTKKWQVPDIWGCKIIKNDNVPDDTLIGFYELLDADDSRNIVLGKIDLKMLNRIDQMKVFW
jgi:hypothetical protein